MNLNLKKRIIDKLSCFNYSRHVSRYFNRVLFGSLLFLNTTFVLPKSISCGNIVNLSEYTKKNSFTNESTIGTNVSNVVSKDLSDLLKYPNYYNHSKYLPTVKYSVNQFKLFPINLTNIDLIGLSISNGNYTKYRTNVFNEPFINNDGLMLFYKNKEFLNFRQKKISNKFKNSVAANNANNKNNSNNKSYVASIISIERNKSENNEDISKNNSDISDVMNSCVNSYDAKNLLARELAISSYSDITLGKFVDNEYFKLLREKDAIMQIKKYNITKGSIVTVVNKTFQKAIVMRIEHLSDYATDNQNDAVLNSDETIYKNMEDAYLSQDYTLVKILCEVDCSTSKIYGNKIFYGDGKTPEGLFFMSSPENSSDWLYEGLLMYGPNFLRLKKSIGIHGNGTDTIRNNLLRKDRRYSAPQQLGIYNNNFGSGLSHGCIRFDNDVLNYLIKNNYFSKGNPIIIFENNNLTKLLSKYYAKLERN
ncbi:MAG: L,D-transpeptidase [Candidatus Woesearchaeota archaeon]